MTLVNDDEIEKVVRVFTEVRRPARATHEGLKNREVDAPRHRHAALLPNIERVDPHQRILSES